MSKQEDKKISPFQGGNSPFGQTAPAGPSIFGQNPSSIFQGVAGQGGGIGGGGGDRKSVV